MTKSRRLVWFHVVEACSRKALATGINEYLTKFPDYHIELHGTIQVDENQGMITYSQAIAGYKFEE